MALNIREALISDLDSLLHLYFKVYGSNYPLKIGTDRKEMARVIGNDSDLWLVAESDGKLIGSLVFEADPIFRIARAEGLVVDPDARGAGISNQLISMGSLQLLDIQKSVNSIYATTRTVTRVPQSIFLRNGFKPLGIFPNAHKLKHFETLTLLVKYNSQAMLIRNPVQAVPADLGALLHLVERQIGASQNYELLPNKTFSAQGDDLDFEFIRAPEFVKRRFLQNFSRPYDRFYPFHEPNLLLSAKNADVEIFAFYSDDGYCTIVALNQFFWQISGRLKNFFHQMRSFGASYIEVLMGIEHTDSLMTLLGMQFLPSAFYPAMWEQDGRTRDMVLMTRSMEPLDFSGIQIEECFKPYIDQYVDLWKKKNLEVLETFRVEY